MTDREKLFKAEDICYELRCQINALDAVHTAMVEGPFTPDTYVDALFFVFASLRDKHEELQNLLKKEGK